MLVCNGDAPSSHISCPATVPTCIIPCDRVDNAVCKFADGEAKLVVDKYGEGFLIYM